MFQRSEFGEHTYIDLLLAKKFYMELHMPGIHGIRNLQDAPTIDNVREIGMADLKDLKKKDPASYKEYAEWLRDDPYVVPGALGELSFPSGMEVQGDKEPEKFSAYFPIMSSEDVAHEGRKEKIQALFRDLFYRDDPKRGGTGEERKEIEHFLDACDTLSLWVSRNHAELMRIGDEGERTNQITLQGKDPVMVDLIQYISRAFEGIYKRHRFSAKQMADKVNLYNNLSRIEKHFYGNEPLDTSGARIEEAKKIFGTGKKIPTENDLAEQAMDEFKDRLIHIDQEYKEVNKLLIDYLPEEIRRMKLRLAKEPAGSPLLEVGQDLIGCIQHKYDQAKNNRSLVDAYNAVSKDPLDGKDFSTLTRKDWIRLDQEYNFFEGVINRYYAAEVLKKEAVSDDETRLYKNVIPCFKRWMENQEKNRPTPKPEWNRLERVELTKYNKDVTTHTIGMTEAMDIAKNIDTLAEGVKNFIQTEKGRPAVKSQWREKAKNTVIVIIEASRKDKITIEDENGKLVEFTPEKFFDTYEKLPKPG